VGLEADESTWLIAIALPMPRLEVPDYGQISVADAIALQKEMRQQVVCADDTGAIRTVAGIDIGIDRANAIARAAVVVVRLEDLVPVEWVAIEHPVTFPYVPGLLGFREVPAAMAALARLTRPPDLLMCDGHGIAHPRRCGLACHLGLLAGIPAIGVAKSRLIGTYAPLDNERGTWQPLSDGDEVIGGVVRTRAGVRPVYVSTGHRVSLHTAIDLVLRCTRGFRLPEPTRQAHRLASRASALTDGGCATAGCSSPPSRC
jgi:deoxyribonuclease V